MAKLSARQESVIKMMTGSEELARWGFGLLLKRADFESFFDALKNAGLFDPNRNPGPAPAGKEGYFYIPYWSALDYLTAIAKLSGEKNDVHLADKIMDVVRAVSAWQPAEGPPQSNYHTFRKFAEILGLVPTAAVKATDTALIEIWLRDKFEPGLVVQALDRAVSNFLTSSSPEDWDKASEVLRYCTARAGSSSERTSKKRAGGQMEDYWVEAMLKRHAGTYGMRVGKKAANILTERVREIFSSEGHRLSSATYRPAVENHSQNHHWHSDENWSVEGLRDIILSWCGSEQANAKVFVRQLMTDELEILRRVAIFVIGERWTELRDVYRDFVSPQLFTSGHLHELYNLLRQHFSDFNEREKAATIEAIRQIPAPTWGEDPARSLRRMQLQWLSAIADKGDPQAEKWLRELQDDNTPIRLPPHPDFASYMETWVGPGPSQYSVQELIAFAKGGIIAEKLNSFEPKNEWDGPTIEGLVAALNDAVKSAPEPFVQLLPNFLHVKRPFQHCVIWGLNQAWQANDQRSELDWNMAWEKLITFFERLIGSRNFWDEKVPQTSAFVGNRDWVVSAISECLDAGTKNDAHAYSIELLPRTRSLLESLLEKTDPIGQPGDDSMFEAINSPRGKVIEALFSQALRTCRVADQANGGHNDAWSSLKYLFDAEIAKCKNTNYEFSTMAGAYLPNLDYMSRDWTKSNIDHIFPQDFSSNSICAIDGLAYATFTLPVYEALAERGVLDRALQYELKGRNARDRLLERIAAGYIWGKEQLESSRFAYMYENGRIEDLAVIARIFWTVREGGLSNEQKQSVIRFWDRCVEWGLTRPEPPAKLFSELCSLSCYLPTADGKDRELLEAVAPFVHDGYNADNFFTELLRLVEVSPDGVSSVLGKAIESRIPSFDFDNRLKSLLLRLAERGKDVILYAERLRGLGMQEVFDSITRMR